MGLAGRSVLLKEKKQQVQMNEEGVCKGTQVVESERG